MIDAIILTVIVGTALLFCGFMLGRNFWQKRGISFTLDSLIEDGYLRYKELEDGQVELIKLDKPTKVQ